MSLVNRQLFVGGEAVVLCERICVQVTEMVDFPQEVRA